MFDVCFFFCLLIFVFCVVGFVCVLQGEVQVVDGGLCDVVMVFWVFDIVFGELVEVLLNIVCQGYVLIVFDQCLVVGLCGLDICGWFSVEDVLWCVLVGSGLVYVQDESGVFVLCCGQVFVQEM